MTVIFTGHCHKLHAHLTHTHALSISHVSHAYLTLTHAHNGLLVPRRDEARRKQRRCARPSRPQQVSGASYPLRGAGGAGGPGAHAGINGQMHGIQGYIQGVYQIKSGFQRRSAGISRGESQGWIFRVDPRARFQERTLEGMNLLLCNKNTSITLISL